ncbi:hypothetical protein D6851_02430 [Altericroceibacterium spongiae]|uniref:Uncharacterized protein n=1 Tax=Altericroceibacterium spongiae TaxID=2320269 RepID=A0A420ERN9_9SPHN|nr:hypothetical protein D6851_02430 [Altericroceibacterium spongiae]
MQPLGVTLQEQRCVFRKPSGVIVKQLQDTVSVSWLSAVFSEENRSAWWLMKDHPAREDIAKALIAECRHLDLWTDADLRTRGGQNSAIGDLEEALRKAKIETEDDTAWILSGMSEEQRVLLARHLLPVVSAYQEAGLRSGKAESTKAPTSAAKQRAIALIETHGPEVLDTIERLAKLCDGVGEHAA